MYDRSIDSQILNFEASGALLSASLVMRDRETDSWWSIMSSKAIGGDLEGASLTELPVGEKTTWQAWSSRHPKTLVLSVDGTEHIDSNPYDDYFDSSDTFGGLEITDSRLEPKEPVFAFWIGGRPMAAPFRAFEGGRAFTLQDGRRLLLTRPAGAPIFSSSRGYLLVGSESEAPADADLLTGVEQLDDVLEPLEGFDTYWYTWISVNPDSALLE